MNTLFVSRRRPGFWGYNCQRCQSIENTAHGWRYAMALAHVHLLERHSGQWAEPEPGPAVMEGECGGL